MAKKKYKCRYCGDEFEGYMTCKAHESICKSNPNIDELKKWNKNDW